MLKNIEKFTDLGIRRAEDAFAYVRKQWNLFQELANQIDKIEKEINSDTISFFEKQRLRKECKELRYQHRKVFDELIPLERVLHRATRFSPLLLLEYILLEVDGVNGISFELFEKVYFSNCESANQTVRQYMANLTGDSSLLFKKYCNDKYHYYHLLLPTSIDNLDDQATPNMILAFCFPSGKKVRVLNLDFNLASSFYNFPFLEKLMRELVNYRFEHPELTQKEVMKELIYNKKHNKVKSIL